MKSTRRIYQSGLSRLAGLIGIVMLGCGVGQSDLQSTAQESDPPVLPSVDGITDGRSPQRPSAPSAHTPDTSANVLEGSSHDRDETSGFDGAKSPGEIDPRLLAEFEHEASTRFDSLDRDLMMLETKVFREDLIEEFAGSVAMLHRLRNDAALAIAEARTADAEVHLTEHGELMDALDLFHTELTMVEENLGRVVNQRSSLTSSLRNLLRE